MESNDPRQIAILILNAFVAWDVPIIQKYLNAANRRKFLPWTDEKNFRLKEYWTKKTAPFGASSLQGIIELRHGPSFLGLNAITGLIAEKDDRVLTINLTYEDSKYLFEDLGVVRRSMYNELKTL